MNVPARTVTRPHGSGDSVDPVSIGFAPGRDLAQTHARHRSTTFNVQLMNEPRAHLVGHVYSPTFSRSVHGSTGQALRRLRKTRIHSGSFAVKTSPARKQFT